MRIRVDFLSLTVLLSFFLLLSIGNISAQSLSFTMPPEHGIHEGTWLQWPHQHQYGETYRDSIESAWIDITRELITGEKVYIIAYDQTEQDRISALLKAQNISLKNVDFLIHKTDDVWIRDNGPLYVKDKTGKMTILNFGFNAWGRKAMFAHCNTIPEKIAKAQGIPVIDLTSKMILEGGSIEIDGDGTLMACKSSILNHNRNPGMTQAQAEKIFKQYLGVSNFIWLDGQAGLDFSDQHIDGFARFANENTIITMNQKDLLNFDVKKSDIDRLYAAKNKVGIAYKFVKIPLTKKDVITSGDKNLGYKGSYINFYISNDKILVPNYNDAHDAVANALIQKLYPARAVVGIDIRDMYENGGMAHCVVMQQPQ